MLCSSSVFVLLLRQRFGEPRAAGCPAQGHFWAGAVGGRGCRTWLLGLVLPASRQSCPRSVVWASCWVPKQLEPRAVVAAPCVLQHSALRCWVWGGLMALLWGHGSWDPIRDSPKPHLAGARCWAQQHQEKLGLGWCFCVLLWRCSGKERLQLCSSCRPTASTCCCGDQD